MLLQPKHVWIVRGRRSKCQMKIETVVGLGSAITPFVHFGMTIPKIETASPVMIARGKIDDLARFRRWWIKTIHLRDKITVIDAVFPFIQENESIYRRRRGHVARFDNYFVALRPRRYRAGKGIIIPHPVIHGHGANMRQALGALCT